MGGKVAAKKLYLIRHGQTGHNHRGIVQGRYVNSKLSKKGILQAEAFYNAYKQIPFQKVYTSTLLRTIQTVKLFTKDGIPHEQLPGLDEICWGESEGLFANGHNNKQYNTILNEWKNGKINSKLEGGESPLDVQQRQKEAMNYIVQQPEDLVLVCMHGRAMRIMLAWMTDTPIQFMDNFDHDNLSLYILHYESDQFFIDTHDERAHLNALREP